MFQGETIYIVRADSEKDIGQTLDRAHFEVDGKTVFAESETYNGPVLERIIKIGD
jgi:hypothetical protein